MKKLILTFSVAVCLLFSIAVTPVRANAGDGHDPGYVCVPTETVTCPLVSIALPEQQGETSGSNTEAAEKAYAPLNLLELVITLILKS